MDPNSNPFINPNTTPPVNATPPVTPPNNAQTDAEKEAARISAEMNKNFEAASGKITDAATQATALINKQTEIQSFFAKPENAAFAPYQNEITRVATDPRFLGWKLDRVIGFTLTPATMMKIGAKMATDAANNATANSTGGNQNTVKAGGNGQVDFNSMSNEDFERYSNGIISGSVQPLSKQV